MTKLTVPLTLGPLTLRNRAVLAPLAGVSDVPFRLICRKLGAGLTFVEMLSAAALVHGNRKTQEMRRRHPDEDVLGVQLTGPTPELVAEAVRILDGEGFDLIDLNMGCSVRKVVNSGCGAAHLRCLDTAKAIFDAARASTRKPLTLKFRLGYDRAQLNSEETARRARRAGFDMVTIHGRTRSERYSTPVDLDGIQRTALAAHEEGGIPCLGNGDIFAAEDATRMLRRTQCDGVMVSRGALGNPWVFREILSEKPATPSVAEWEEIVLEHISLQKSHFGDHKGAATAMRKHLIWYASGFPGSRSLREQLTHVESLDDARELVRRYAEALPRELERARREPSLSESFDPKFDMEREPADDGTQAHSAGSTSGLSEQ